MRTNRWFQNNIVGSVVKVYRTKYGPIEQGHLIQPGRGNSRKNFLDEFLY
jgi:hypothetical protein